MCPEVARVGDYWTGLLGPPYRVDGSAVSGSDVILLDIVLVQECGWDIPDMVRTEPAT